MNEGQYTAWWAEATDFERSCWYEWGEIEKEAPALWFEEKQRTVCPVCWNSVKEGWMTKPQVRKAASAAVGGAYARPQDERGILDFQGNNARSWKQSKGEGSRLLASLLARFWEPLNEAEGHEIWQAIIGDHGALISCLPWERLNNWLRVRLPVRGQLHWGLCLLWQAGLLRYEGCDVGMPPGTRVKSGINPHTKGRSERTFKGIAAAGQPKTIGGNIAITAPSTPLAKRAERLGSGLKPAWEPVVVARKPLCGTLCDNFEKWGTGGLNIDECRIGLMTEAEIARSGQSTNGMFARGGLNWKRNGRQPQGRWPANLILSHSEDCIRVGTKRVKGTKPHPVHSKVEQYDGWGNITQKHGEVVNKYEDPDGYAQVEDWVCVESCLVRLLDEQSGATQAHPSDYNYAEGHTNTYGWAKGGIYKSGQHYGDRGGASRFFYCAKASRKERTADGAVENKHPTVKPIALGRYLIRLVTPPGGIVLDPFCGSGSFLVSAIEEGFDCIGMDNREEACQIAIARCREAGKQARLL